MGVRTHHAAKLSTHVPDGCIPGPTGLYQCIWRRSPSHASKGHARQPPWSSTASPVFYGVRGPGRCVPVSDLWGKGGHTHFRLFLTHSVFSSMVMAGSARLAREDFVRDLRGNGDVIRLAPSCASLSPAVPLGVQPRNVPALTEVTSPRPCLWTSASTHRQQHPSGPATAQTHTAGSIPDGKGSPRQTRDILRGPRPRNPSRPKRWSSGSTTGVTPAGALAL